MDIKLIIKILTSVRVYFQKILLIIQSLHDIIVFPLKKDRWRNLYIYPGFTTPNSTRTLENFVVGKYKVTIPIMSCNVINILPRYMIDQKSPGLTPQNLWDNQGRRKNNKKYSRIFSNGCLLILFTIFSCAPFTKDSYMKDFAIFMDKVTKESNMYSEKEWSEVEEDYHLFTETWQKKFEDEFTPTDKLRIKKYEVQFNVIRAKRLSSDFLNLFP